ncbi:MAG: SdrD B-like domain-containing protein [Planctomycetota bacterium]
MPARRRPKTRRPARRFQRLEDRRMLATDMAQITGVVQNDTDGDGVGDTVFTDTATVELVRSDGTVFGTTMTDNLGVYTFTGVTADTYQVRAVTGGTTGLLARNNSNTAAVTVTPDDADGAVNRTIDEFDNAVLQKAEVTRNVGDPLPPPDNQADGSNTSSGGVRDLQAELTAGAGEISIASNEFGLNGLSITASVGVSGTGRAVWDGTDNNAANVDIDGFITEGIDPDLTGGGANTGFLINATRDQNAVSFRVRLHDETGQIAEVSANIIDDDGTIDGAGDPDEQILLAFDDFRTNNAAIDLTRIGAIEVVVDASGNGIDALLDVVGVVGATQLNAPAVVVSDQLSLGDTVFVDRNDDGLLNNGDAGKPGVTVHLYEDTDGDGEYTDEAAPTNDTTAVTDANGRYLFDGLFPGEYLVVVPSEELTTGGTLAGFRSSDGNDDGMGMAPDPDNDTDNDDNGTPVTTGLGAGDVASKPITLTGGGETGADGDADPDINRSLDFGFVGYDLDITKTDDDNDQSLTPGETIVYTLTVDHITGADYVGSIATGALVTDTLPAGLTFVPAGAGSVSTAETSRTDNPDGTTVLTYNLPDLAPEDAPQTILIQATVDGDAGMMLQNAATVAAVDDVNFANNAAIASSTIEPEIDVQITKTDDDGGLNLAPGDTVIYTLSVQNNGPSAATNVVVTDTLRAGLTFTPSGAGSASDPPVTSTLVNGDRVLTYNLGTLQPGDPPVTIRVEATVDEGFTGLARNDAEVAADELETNTGNNTAFATSTVETPLGTISGQVFLDIDGDNVLEAEDTPLGGVTLTLFNALGQPVGVPQTTDAQGRYRFVDVFPGTYTVRQTQPVPFTDLDETSGTTGATTGVDNEISNIRVLTGGNGADAQANNFTEGPPTLGKRSFFASTLGLLN